MDTESWPRLSSYSRRYQSRSDVHHGEVYEQEEEQMPEYLCPFCAEDFDMVGLCCHIDEEHAVEAKNGVCPVCAKKVGSDLIRHLTLQHGNILKVQRRRRLRRGGSGFSFANLRKELREGNVHSLLGGSSFLVPSSRAEPDPLLSSFISNPPAVDEPSIVKPVASVLAGSAGATSVDNAAVRVAQQTPPLSDEDLKENAQRCKFVQGLVLSTFLDDNS